MLSGLWWEPSCAAPKLWAKSWPRSAPSTPTWILARPSFTSTRRTFESSTPPGKQDHGGTLLFRTAINRHPSLPSRFPSTWPRLQEAFNCYRVQGWLWRQRHDWASAVHPKSLGFTVIWNYYAYLVLSIYVGLRTKRALWMRWCHFSSCFLRDK